MTTYWKLTIITVSWLAFFLPGCKARDTFGTLGNILPLKNGKLTYSGVVQAEGTSKDELYERAKHWVVDTIRFAESPNCPFVDTIQLDKRNEGKVNGKGSFTVIWMGTFNTEYYTTYECLYLSFSPITKILVKDGQYSYEITDFEVSYLILKNQHIPTQDPGVYDMPFEPWAKKFEKISNVKALVYPEIDSDVKSIVESLTKAMKTSLNK